MALLEPSFRAWVENGGPPLNLPTIERLVVELRDELASPARKMLVLLIDENCQAEYRIVYGMPDIEEFVGVGIYSGIQKLWNSHTVGLTLPLLILYCPESTSLSLLICTPLHEGPFYGSCGQQPHGQCSA